MPTRYIQVRRRFRNNTDNTENNGEYDKECIELWEKTIDDMMFSFKEISLNYKNSPYYLYYEKKYGKIPQKQSDKTKEEILNQEKEYRDRISHGLQLFSEYFEALWD